MLEYQSWATFVKSDPSTDDRLEDEAVLWVVVTGQECDMQRRFRKEEHIYKVTREEVRHTLFM